MNTSAKFIARVIVFLGLVVSFFPLAGRAGYVVTWGDVPPGQSQNSNALQYFTAISAGDGFTVGLRQDGTVAAWGLDNGNGGTNVPPGLSNVTAIASGPSYTMALKADGTLTAWGAYGMGESVSNLNLPPVVGIAAGWFHWTALKTDGTILTHHAFNNAAVGTPPSGLAGVTAVAAGYEYSLALKSNGKVVGWGAAGLNASVVPPGLSNVIAISAGHFHALALRTDGKVVAWGDNYFGEAIVPEGLSDVVAIAAGNYFSLALKSDGTVVGWGYDPLGKLSIPSGLKRVTAIALGRSHVVALSLDGPIDIEQQPVDQFVRVGSNAVFSVVATGQEPLSYQWFFDTNALVDNARISGANGATLTIAATKNVDSGLYQVVISNAFGTAISASAALTLLKPPEITFRTPDQTVRAGSDVNFQVVAIGTSPVGYSWLFNGTNLPGETSPVLSLVNVQPSASGTYSVLVTNLYGSVATNISLTVTGSAPYIVRQPYQLPNQTVVSNVVVSPGAQVSWSIVAKGSLPLSYQWRFNGVDIPGATNASLVLSDVTYDQSGFYNAVVRNPIGEVISGKVSLNVVQVLVSGNPPGSVLTNVPGGLTNVIALAAGSSHVLALRSDRSLVAWGGSLSGNSSPTNIPVAAINIVAIAAANATSMALRADGRVFVWGDNLSMTTIPVTASNGIMAIADGGSHCLALNTNGSIVAWGDRTYGQTTVPPALSNVVTAIGAGAQYSLALKTDGKVVAWGGNAAQTNIPAGLSNVISIAAGQYHALALKSDGRVVTWGVGSVGATNVPATLSNVVAIAAGYYSSLALQADGTLVTWGNLPPISPAGGKQSVSNVIAMAASQTSVGSSFYVAALGDGRPGFVLDPASQSVVIGTGVQLHARAVGRQPMHYQWQFNGSNLPDATNADLILPNFQAQNFGLYRVVASNVLGSVTSGVANLKLFPYLGTLSKALNWTNTLWDTYSGTSKTVGVWFGQMTETHDGDAAAQSGAIDNSQQSTLQTTVTGPGTLTFWWKVSSEQGYDFLTFTALNGSVSPFPATSISGEAGWEQKTFSIPSGVYTLKWVYSKDGSVSAGRDAAWVDQVVFAPPPPVINQQPFGRTAVLNETVFLSVNTSGSGTLNYQWLKDGTNLSALSSRFLTLTNVSRRNTGSYSVRVSNLGGSVLSSNAFLRVRVPQQLSFPQRLDNGQFELKSADLNHGPVSSNDLNFLEAQYSTNLVDWTRLPDALQLTNGVLHLLDSSSADEPMRFYRIVEH